MLNKIDLRDFESTKKYCEEVAEKSDKENKAARLYVLLADGIILGLMGKPYYRPIDKNFFKTKRNINVYKDLPQHSYFISKEKYECLISHFEELGEVKYYCEELMTDYNGNDEDWKFNVDCNYDNIKHYLTLLSSKVIYEKEKGSGYEF